MQSLVMVGVLAVVSCAPHVALRLPADPTPEQRVAMYQALEAQIEKTTWTTTCSGACSTTVKKELRLANGTTVHYPEDLLPVVPSHSVAAREVERALTARRRGRYAALGAVASWVGFGVAGVYWWRNADARESSDPTTGEALAIGAAALGAVVSGLFVWYYNGQYAHHFGEANYAFNDGLAEQLNVCVSGYALVPCETMSTGAMTPRLRDAIGAPAPRMRAD